MSINTILEELAADNSRLAKEAILKKHLDNELLKECIRLALSPFVQFYIRKIPEYKVTGKKLTLEKALKLLDKLSSREFTGHAAIDFLATILGELDASDARVIEKIIAKDLRCGVSEATANKIWKKLVPTYPIMLASGYDEKLVEKISWPAYAQLKLDGMRFNAIVQNGKVTFSSRNGKILDIPNKDFELPFLKMVEQIGLDCIFDGELLVSDSAGNPLDRQTGNGILSKSIKGTMSEKEAGMVRATLWDVIPYDAWNRGSYSIDYKARITRLVQALLYVEQKYASVNHYVSMVLHKEVSSIHAAEKLFEKYLAEGQEGIILKDPKGIWEDKRAKHQVKFKAELDCDLRVVGWEEGTGKNVGRLGALVCESEDGDICVNVGSGYSDEQRTSFTKAMIGSVITVMYNARITERSGEQSLFLPRFVEVRLDKNKADCSKNIK